MAKKVIVVRIGTNEVQIVHMEHTANYPTVYGCVRFPTPENAVKDGMIIEVTELATCIRKACADKGIRTKDVIFTVASGKIASRETSVPIAKKKMKIQPLVMGKIYFFLCGTGGTEENRRGRTYSGCHGVCSTV